MYISNSILQIIKRMNPQRSRPDKEEGGRTGQIFPNLTSCLEEGGGASPCPKSFKWMHEGDKVLNQGMIAHVDIIDGTLLEETVWASLFPFILHDIPLNRPSEVGCNVVFRKNASIVNMFNICTS